MARKPNYSFERNSRAQAKAKKREAKRQARLAAKAEKQSAESIPEPNDEAASTDTAADVTAQRLID